YVASRHYRGAGARALLTAGDASADEPQALGAQLAGAARRVVEVGVAAVDDDVTGLEERFQRGDHLIDRLTGLHHQHHAAWSRQSGYQVGQRFEAHDLGAGGRTCYELAGHLGSPVVDTYLVAVIVHVEDQVLAHDRQTDQCDVELASGCGCLLMVLTHGASLSRRRY